MGDEATLKAYVAHLRQNHPEHRAVREYDARQEALRASLAAMKAVEWRGTDVDVHATGGIYSCCPCCTAIIEALDGDGHAPDCQLAGAIKKVEGVLGDG